MSSEISVVIVSYNSQERTLLEALKSLQESSLRPAEIIIVDNSPGNHLRGKILSEFGPSMVTWIESQENLGFAKGCNRGARPARSAYILFMNEDAVVEKNCLAKLVEVLESKPKMAAAAPTIFLAENRSKIWFAGGKIYPWFGYCAEDKESPDFLKQTAWLTGCVLLVRRDLFLSLGLFDEGFFLYFEDVDFSLRARRQGYSLVVCPSAIALHGREGLVGRSSDSRLAEVYHSKFYFFWKNFKGPVALSAFFFQLLIVSLYDLIFWGQWPWVKFRSFWHFILEGFRGPVPKS